MWRSNTESEADDAQLAQAFARDLLNRLHCAQPLGACHSDHPARAWRRAGLMAVTGAEGGPGLVAPLALTAAADGALAALAALAPLARLPANGAVLLGERARLLGLQRGGRVSANRSCRLLRAADGEIAVNLPRKSDWEQIPAWLEVEATTWDAIERALARCEIDTLLSRARVLGLAVSVCDGAAPNGPPFVVQRFRAPPRRGEPPLVVDMSGLWAGPLAGALLRDMGARVIKVESTRRPDGGRFGDANFYALLNAGKESVALDFHAPEDVRRLQRLIAAADIVIESARPRALAQLGIDAREIAARGGVWLSITAHGREGAASERVGFGDDAAIEAGLAAAMRRHWGEAQFAGDAIADPLTGLVGAVAAWAGWLSGGAQLISAPLSAVTRYACALFETHDTPRWQAMACADEAPLYPLRTHAGRAPALGADSERVLAELSSLRRS